MDVAPRAGLTIGRMVARCSERDLLGLRLRLESNLQAAGIEPAGLPPDAVLCIRRLTDPVPGQFPARRGGSMPPAAWRSAMERRLGSLVQGAARPALGENGENAEAVLFVDEPELLAALAAEWLTVGTLERWWWKHVATMDDPVAAWRRSPRAIPEAMEILAARSLLTSYCSRLPELEATRLTGLVIREFGMARLRACLDQPEPSSRRDEHGAASVDAPWHSLAPEIVGENMPVPAELLAGVGLTLARSPAMARSEDFGGKAARWVWNRQHDRPADGQPLDGDGPSAAESAPAGKGNVVRESGQRRSGWRSAQAGRSLNVRGQREVATPGQPESTPSATAETIDPARVAPSSVDPFHGMGRGTSATHSAPARSAGSHTAANSNTRIDLWSRTQFQGRVVDTEIGGVFFLANVALALGLYPDFTRPDDRGIDCDFWSFMDGAARRLLDDAPDDPLWGMLARLAGHSDDQSWSKIPEWRIPPQWLASETNDRPWRYATGAGRLQVEHPAGFTMLDIPWTGAANDDDVWRELGGAPLPPTLNRVPVDPVPGGPLDWWNYVMTYVRFRLRIALRTDTDREAIHLLIRQPARIVVTPRAVTVTYSLERHPVAIRLAGLDRDPGWIPAAGRSITFRFEPEGR